MEAFAVPGNASKNVMLDNAEVWYRAGTNVLNLPFGELGEIMDLNACLDRLYPGSASTRCRSEGPVIDPGLPPYISRW